MKKIFTELDLENTGSVNLSDLFNSLGERENAEALLGVLEGADTDGNGVIDYTGKLLNLKSANFGKSLQLFGHFCVIEFIAANLSA